MPTKSDLVRLTELGTTNDIALILSPTPENLARLADILRELDARVLNPGGEHLQITAQMLPRSTLWQFATRHGDIDVLHDAPGAAPFPQLRERALVIALGDHPIPVASRDDLIKMKRAAGRPIDLAISPRSASPSTEIALEATSCSIRSSQRSFSSHRPRV